MRRFDDKVVVITGAAGGIGRALAQAFAARGARLALIDLGGPGLAELAAELPASANASTHVASVADPAELARARIEILAHHGQVDVLINNAGMTVFAQFEAMEVDEIERVIAVNLRGVIDGCRVFLPGSARAALRPHRQPLEHRRAGRDAVADALLRDQVRGAWVPAALRTELVGERIGVTCVLPGATRTNIVGAAASRDPALSAGLSGLLLAYGYPPPWVARKVVRAVRWNRAELLVGPDGLALGLGVRVAPRAGARGHAGVGLGRAAAG